MGRKTGVAQADHARVVVGHPLDRACAQAGDDAHESLFTLEPRRPQEGVTAKAYARQGWEEVTLVFAAFDLLQDDRHALVVVDQAHLASIEQRVGAEDAGVDLRGRPHQVAQVLLARALVGTEDAFIFPCKGRADVVLQQAGGAHDQRCVAHVVEQAVELRDHAVGETTVGEALRQGRVVLDDLLRRLVFLV